MLAAPHVKGRGEWLQRWPALIAEQLSFPELVPVNQVPVKQVRRFADAQASLDAEAEEREGELAAAWAKIRELQAALAAAGG